MVHPLKIGTKTSQPLEGLRVTLRWSLEGGNCLSLHLTPNGALKRRVKHMYTPLHEKYASYCKRGDTRKRGVLGDRMCDNGDTWRYPHDTSWFFLTASVQTSLNLLDFHKNFVWDDEIGNWSSNSWAPNGALTFRVNPILTTLHGKPQG